MKIYCRLLKKILKFILGYSNLNKNSNTKLYFIYFYTFEKRETEAKTVNWLDKLNKIIFYVYNFSIPNLVIP